MKTLSLFLTLLCLSFSMMGQDETTENLKALYEAGEYEKIIAEYSEQIDTYSARSVYYIGISYFMAQDDNNALKVLDLSIEKDPTDPDPYFMKGATYNYLGKFEKAVLAFKKAVEIDPESSDYFSGLGDAHFNLDQLDQALAAYKEATTKEEAIDRPYNMIPHIYLAQGKPEDALNAFYTAKENISKESESYINLLYNIGLSELLKQDYDKAEPVFKELISLNPNDYHAYAKLIQVYYGKENFEAAIPYRDKLYEAHEKELLQEQLKDMFCFDQFEWEDKLIQVFERFEEPEGELYYKHLFYVVNQENEIEYRIQTENSPISVELGSGKYIMGMNKGDTHYTFPYGFDEEFEYPELKKLVIAILEEKIKPSASSRRN